jgi:hypothetical protein
MDINNLMSVYSP